MTLTLSLYIFIYFHYKANSRSSTSHPTPPPLLTQNCESCWDKVEAGLPGEAQLRGWVVQGGVEEARQDGNQGLQAGQHSEDLPKLTGGDAPRHLGSDGGGEDEEEETGQGWGQESFLRPGTFFLSHVIKSINPKRNRNKKNARLIAKFASRTPQKMQNIT